MFTDGARCPGWAGYAACAWAAPYAIGVRGYQGLGGTVGLPGVLEDPAGGRRASLLAGALILVAGMAALALVRPWGLRLTRRLVVIAALAGSVLAITHALIAYVTKPLHLLGVIGLEFTGWKHLDETAAILWDLLFYEPWFLGLGALVTLAAPPSPRSGGWQYERMAASPARRGGRDAGVGRRVVSPAHHALGNPQGNSAVGVSVKAP